MCCHVHSSLSLSIILLHISATFPLSSHLHCRFLKWSQKIFKLLGTIGVFLLIAFNRYTGIVSICCWDPSMGLRWLCYSFAWSIDGTLEKALSWHYLIFPSSISLDGSFISIPLWITELLEKEEVTTVEFSSTYCTKKIHVISQGMDSQTTIIIPLYINKSSSTLK